MFFRNDLPDRALACILIDVLLEARCIALIGHGTVVSCCACVIGVTALACIESLVSILS